jgi:uracil-DNA glycosylase family 4
MEDLKTDKATALDLIAQAITGDRVTPHLAQSATQLVFGAGNPDADVVFIGEAPGKNEDLRGEPFVGAAGKFLNEMLASIGLERKDIYITNIVKYRPPDNRDPTVEEIEAFKPYLEQQMIVINPKLIVFLGRHSMNVFLPELKISQAHGHPVRKDGQVYLPLFHPAAALYNGGMRDTLMADFALIPAIIKKIT